MLTKKELETAYDKFVRVGFAGLSLLRRELKINEHKSRAIMSFMVSSGVIAEFDGIICQKLLITDKEKAMKCLGF